MKGFLVLAVVSGLLMVQPVFGQEETVSVQQRGPHSISLGVNDSSAAIGYWHKISDKTDVGLDFLVYYSNHNDTDFSQYRLNPAIRHYLAVDKSASPYLYYGLTGSYSKNKNEVPAFQSTTETYTAGIMGGIGLEWFPIRNLSVGGHVGARAQYESTRRSTSNSSTFVSPSSSKDKDDGFAIGTFNSGIRLNLFF